MFQASGGCLGRKVLSSALRTKDELLPQHRLFTCSYFLGISVGLQAPLLMGLCRTTPGFSHLKGQVLKIIRGQCVVRRQQQVLRFWGTWTKTKKLVCLVGWLVFISWHGWVLERVVRVLSYGLVVMGSWLKVCITETCVSLHWWHHLIAESGREKYIKSLGCGVLLHLIKAFKNTYIKQNNTEQEQIQIHFFLCKPSLYLGFLKHFNLFDLFTGPEVLDHIEKVERGRLEEQLVLLG